METPVTIRSLINIIKIIINSKPTDQSDNYQQYQKHCERNIFNYYRPTASSSFAHKLIILFLPLMGNFCSYEQKSPHVSGFCFTCNNYLRWRLLITMPNTMLPIIKIPAAVPAIPQIKALLFWLLTFTLFSSN